MSDPIEPTANGVVLTVQVIPRAARPGLAGTRNGALLVRLTAPPVDGAANDALIALLADVLGTARRQITIVSGATSRRKRVKIDGLDVASAASRLARSTP